MSGIKDEIWIENKWHFSEENLRKKIEDHILKCHSKVRIC